MIVAAFIAFFRDEPDEQTYQHRSFETMPDGSLITRDDRGYCPGSCHCLECAHRRATVRRANRLKEVFRGP